MNGTFSSDLSVLMVGPSLDSRGGMATFERQLVDMLPHYGVRVRFVSTYDDRSLPKRLSIAARGYHRFRRELQECDIVHIHMASRGSYERKKFFALHALDCGLPTVIHLHGGEFSKWYEGELDDSKRREVRSLFERISALVVLSEEWRDWVLSTGCRPKRLVVMHNAVLVPPEVFDSCSRQDILFLGRLDARKSPDVLLRASSKVLGGHPSTKVILAGDGFCERYHALAGKLGIADRCEFPGWVTGDAREMLFSRAAVYCLPSKNEGMPMSVLEAMAHGIPTVATPVGGIPQVITNELNGFLMPVDDDEALARVLDHLLKDPGLRDSVGAAGRETISRDFNAEKNIDALVTLYKEVLGYSRFGY